MKNMEAQIFYSLDLTGKGIGQAGANASCRPLWCCVADVVGSLWTYLINKDCWSNARSIWQKWGSSIFTNRLTNLVRITLSKKKNWFFFTHLNNLNNLNNVFLNIEFKDWSGKERQVGQWNTVWWNIIPHFFWESSLTKGTCQVPVHERKQNERQTRRIGNPYETVE